MGAGTGLSIVWLGEAVEVWLAELSARNYAASTIRFRRTALRRLAGSGVIGRDSEARALTRHVLRRYQGVLANARSARGTCLAWSTQAEELVVVKGFLRWCARQGVLRKGLDDTIMLPRRPRHLPRGVLTVAEVERVLAQPMTGTVLGLRDRAILETLYSTGMRRNEVRRLRHTEVDWTRAQVFVREGKRGKDRIVPIGERALYWLARYLAGARPMLTRDAEEPHVFLSCRGHALTGNMLSELVSRCLRGAGLGERGSCHLLRHTVATLMLEGGADIRQVQELLGHARIESTVRYAHVSVLALKAAHRRAHPAEQEAETWRRLRERFALAGEAVGGLGSLD